MMMLLVMVMIIVVMRVVMMIIVVRMMKMIVGIIKNMCVEADADKKIPITYGLSCCFVNIYVIIVDFFPPTT